MKRFISATFLLLLLLVGTASTLKKNQTVYAFGVAASFNDTIVYWTPIQVLDSVTLDKNGFLPRREAYTYQLKNYLEYTLKQADYTCMLYFSDDKAKLEKEEQKLKGKYKKSKGLHIQQLDAQSFSFKKPEE